MITIKFKIDEDIIARRIISKNCMPTSFANYLWEKHNDSYKLLKSNFLSENIDLEIINELKKTNFFQKDIQQAKSNLKRIKKNWLDYKTIILDCLKNIFKTEIQLNVICYITQPNLNTGVNIGNNQFLWGHINGLSDKNYDLVYLIHESLHSLFNKGDLEHAIIEKIADIELSRKLNKTDNCGYPTHCFTKDFHKQIFPFWNLYMKRSYKTILKEQEIFKIAYNINKFEIYRKKLEKINIFDFIKFLKQEIPKLN